LKSYLVGLSGVSAYLRGDALSFRAEKGENSRVLLAIDTWRLKTMTRVKILGAAAMLSLMFVTPVFAQAAIQEPGAYAFYYPNYDVLNGGQPTPAARMDAIAGRGPFSGSYAYATPDSTAPTRARLNRH
jgi:hypothetical protein